MSYKEILKRKLSNLAVIAAFLMLLLLLATLTSGCAQAEATDAQTLRIVTTTTMLSDLTRIIGGEDVAVTALMGAGVDPHLYQASAGDVRKMQEANVVVYHGLHLEGKMGDVLEALAQQGRAVICVEEGIARERLLPSEGNASVYDPHVWFDVSIWGEVAQYVCARLSELDAAHAEEYAHNLEQYLQQLADLEQEIAASIAQIPQAQRVLITAHDAFRYFGAAYGIEVIGLQGISTDAQAGTADVSALATLIVQREIRAVFPETSIASRSMQALQAAVEAQGGSVRMGGALYSDSLGDAEHGHESYTATVRANVEMITQALTEE